MFHVTCYSLQLLQKSGHCLITTQTAVLPNIIPIAVVLLNNNDTDTAHLQFPYQRVGERKFIMSVEGTKRSAVSRSIMANIPRPEP